MLLLLASPNVNCTIAGCIASVLEDILTTGGGRILAQHPSKFALLYDNLLSAFAPIYVKVRDQDEKAILEDIFTIGVVTISAKK